MNKFKKTYPRIYDRYGVSFDVDVKYRDRDDDDPNRDRDCRDSPPDKGVFGDGTSPTKHLPAAFFSPLPMQPEFEASGP